MTPVTARDASLLVVDEVGRVLDTAAIYPTKPYERIEDAKKIVISLIKSTINKHRC